MPPKDVKKQEGQQTPDWGFAPRDVAFTATLRATFHPRVKDAVVSFQWPGLNGLPPTTVSFGALGTLEADATPKPSDTSPKSGFLSVRAEKELGTFPLALAFVESIRSARLPIAIKLKPDGAEHEKKAQLHLGPLLLSGGSSELGGRALEMSLKRTTRFPGSMVLASCAEDLAVVGLQFCELQVSTNMPLLSQPMLEKLIPACFTVEVVRNLPNECSLSTACEEVFLEVYPKVSATTMSMTKACPRVFSRSRPHNAQIRFLEPVVWFLGHAPLHAVREWMQHEGLVVEIHDRDAKCSVCPEVTPEERKEAQVMPRGVASFSLAPLLEPVALEVAMSADVFPARGDKKKRRAEALKGDSLTAQGLIEDEGRAKIARKMAAGLDKCEDTAGYHGAGTVCSIRAALAVPLPQSKTLQRIEEQSQAVRWGSEETRQGTSNVWKASAVRSEQVAGQPPRSPRSTPFRVKMPMPTGDAKVPVSATGQVLGPWRKTKAEADDDERRLTAAAEKAKTGKADPVAQAKAAAEVMSTLAKSLESDAGDGLNRRYERYSRLVYTAEDTDLPSVQAILNTVRMHNASVLGVDPMSTALLMYELSPEEKTDPHLDLLTGFAVLDGNPSRVIVVEGLRDQPGLQKLLKAAPRGLELPDYDATPSSDPSAKRQRPPMRLLHNPNIGFAERLYLDFGPRLKQIKVRGTLERLAMRPDFYIWSEAQSKETLVAAEAPKLLLGLKLAPRISFLRGGAPFPATEHLLNLEMLYGAYVTDEELEGLAAPKSPIAKHAKKTGLRRGEASTAITDGDLGLNERTAKMSAISRSSLTKAPVDMGNTSYEETLAMRGSVSMPNFLASNRDVVKQLSEENAKRNIESGRKREREGPFQEGQQVFNYSTQRLNSSALHKVWMQEKMDPQQKTKMWTYNEAYLSQSFDFSGASPPGRHAHQASCPNDSYSRLEGDSRPVWRPIHARTPEELKKLDKDVGPARVDELKLAFAENELHMLTCGDGRHRPVAEHFTFDLGKNPHLTRTIEQPFHPAMAKPNPIGYFGKPTDLESVYYYGREPGESLGAEAEMQNMTQRALQPPHLGASILKTFSQGCTRNAITTLDRCEATLKDPPAVPRKGDIEKPFPSSIRIYEPFHDLGRPDKEWHARLRENDSSPPLDVVTGTYLKRDPEVGNKLGCMSGTLGKSPWSHGSTGATMVKAASRTGRGLTSTHAYPSAKDFDRTKKPQPEKLQIFKNASRMPISAMERSTSLQYLRPGHYGVSLTVL